VVSRDRDAGGLGRDCSGAIRDDSEDIVVAHAGKEELVYSRAGDVGREGLEVESYVVVEAGLEGELEEVVQQAVDEGDGGAGGLVSGDDGRPTRRGRGGGVEVEDGACGLERG
jgi:hypothetical protein